MKYQIIHTVTAFNPGEIRDESEFPVDTDFDRLIRLKAVHPTEGPPPVVDDGDAAGWKRRAEVAEAKLADVDELKAQIEELEGSKSTLESVLPTTQRGLESLGIDQLKTLADHKGVELSPTASKAEVVGAIASASSNGIATGNPPAAEPPATEPPVTE